MMTIVYDISPDQFDLDKIALRRGLESDAITYLSHFQEELDEEHDTLAGSPESSVIFEYKVAFVKKSGEADVSLVVGPQGEKILPVHIPKDAATTHPYRMRELLNEVKVQTSGTFCPSTGDIAAVRYAYEIEKKQAFFYQSGIKNVQKQYSNEFVEWLIERHTKDAKFLPMARDKYKREYLSRPKSS